RRFLEETDETAVTPEAMRRLADLQLEAGAGTYDFVKEVRQTGGKSQDRAAAAQVRQESIAPGQFGKSEVTSPILAAQADAGKEAQTTAENQKAFEDRATRIADIAAGTAATALGVLPGGEEID